MEPVVLVLSFGEHQKTPVEIIENILRITNSINKTPQNIDVNISQYVCNITTKYYNVDISLVPVATTNLAELPEELLKRTEGVIAYFDANNRGFLQNDAKDLVTFLESRDIEMALLLTNVLSDEVDTGITYECAKKATNLLFDVIELQKSKADEDDDEAEAESDAYSEVHEALRNHIWSNVEYPTKGVDTLNRINNQMDTSEDIDDLEDQLESFEHLLRSIQNFKNLTANMDREEMLDHAEKLAELFSDLLVEE